MEDTTVKRRGRPPKTAFEAQAEMERPTASERQAEVEAAAPPKRRRRASVGGHALKLQAPQRPGFVRRWVNDDGNRIANAEELAYDFVHEPGAQSTDVGSRVSRLVGTKANGEPLRSYLMETPEEEYRAGQDEKEAHLRQIDEAMTRIVDETGQTAMPKDQQYGHVSIKRD